MSKFKANKAASLFCVVALLACGSAEETGEIEVTADLLCPGDPSGVCDAVQGAQLEAGVAIESIVPQCFEAFVDLNDDGEYSASSESFLDCGCDRLCVDDEGYTGPDEGEGDGAFQAVWMAGFQNGRPANAVRGADVGLMGEGDGLWASAVVLQQGNTTLGIVSLDLVGWFFDDVLDVRQRLTDRGVQLDHVLIASTHGHEGPDTMGMWGASVDKSGQSQDYQEFVKERILDALQTAASTLQPVSMSFGEVDVSSYSEEKGIANVLRDSRDPWIIDPSLYGLKLAAADGSTVATLINWSNHPETVADENNLMTSDYVHALRKTVEASQGGQCVFLNGTVGGMMTSLGVHHTDKEGITRSAADFDKADAIGMDVGQMAIDAIEGAQAADSPELAFAVKRFNLPIVNRGFQAMFLIGVLQRTTFDWDPDEPITAENQPYLQTEMNLIQLGPVHMLSVPGEMLPELAIGGYDGEHLHSPTAQIISADNPNPPDLTQAPTGPFLKERMQGQQNWILGLANDELGYIIPPYNFKVHEHAAFILEPEGDHYEETNSMGPHMAPAVDEQAGLLMGWLQEATEGQ